MNPIRLFFAALVTGGAAVANAQASFRVDETTIADVHAAMQAGAIVLAKSNMAEFAFSPLETVNSLQGYSHNPYDTSRVTAGSSGGTAAAVAGDLGEVGLGT